jgi:hypothetical protein
MNNPIERIEMLDLTLFDPIFSQTEPRGQTVAPRRAKIRREEIQGIHLP